MGIATAERDRLRSDHAAAPIGLKGDVRPLAERRQEVAVRLAPRAALVPRDVRELRVRVLTGEAVEASSVAVDPDGHVWEIAHNFELKIVFRIRNVDTVVACEALQQSNSLMEQAIPALAVFEFQRSFAIGTPFAEESGAAIFPLE